METYEPRQSSRHEIRLTVNGKQHHLTVESRKLLVDVLREDLGLTGVHVGCEQGVCGNCTVILNGNAINSCLAFAVQAHESEITTIEGLAPGEELHPLQESFKKHHAMQCGYCTPGTILNAKDLLDKVPEPGVGEIKEALSGTMCRCGCYDNIVEAIQDAAGKVEG